MKFKITISYRRILIEGEGERYCVFTKLFSLNSKLATDDGLVIAKMKRKSWWRMNYTVQTNNGLYDLISEGLGQNLIHRDSGTRLYHMGAPEFLIGREVVATYSESKNENEFVADLKRKLTQQIRYEFDYEIKSEEHWQAILLASCNFWARTNK